MEILNPFLVVVDCEKIHKNAPTGMNSKPQLDFSQVQLLPHRYMIPVKQVYVAPCDFKRKETIRSDDVHLRKVSQVFGGSHHGTQKCFGQ